jgi:hypothetical protein
MSQNAWHTVSCRSARTGSTHTKTRPPRNAGHRGNQNAPKSIFFQHPASGLTRA